MKKLICYFVLISSFLCGVGGASSNRGGSNINNEDREWAIRTGPHRVINMMFNNENGLKNHDLRLRDEVIAAPRTIYDMYPNRPDLQRQAVDTLGQCMRNQMINGQRKYTDRDVQVMVTYSKRMLGLN